MEGKTIRKEAYYDIAGLNEDLNFSELDKNEKIVVSYLCDTISSADDINVIKKKVERNEPYSQLQLAQWYIDNAQNVKDYCAAYKVSQKALKEGYLEAHYLLGQLYLYGAGCMRSYIKAKKHLKLFVENIKIGDLENSSAIEDAYLKLAEVEKKQKHFDKAYKYYKKLMKINSDYEGLAKAYFEEINDLRKESISMYIFVAGTLVLIGAIAITCFYWLPKGQYEFVEKYALEPKVIREEASPTYMVPEKIDIKDAVSYAIISESDFNKLNLKALDASSVYASSEYISKVGNYFGTDNLTDGKASTYWQEGETDAGINQKIVFNFDDSYIISAMKILNGKQLNQNGFIENNRVASLSMFGEENLTINLSDAFEPQYIIFENPLYTNNVEMVIKSVFSGTVYNDTCISEIQFYE